MKTKYFSVLGALVLVGACNQGTGSSPGTASQAVVTIEGTNPAELRSALLALSEVTIFADGRELSSSIERASADLARQGDKLTVRFAIPAEARQIDVRLDLDDFGGYDANGGEAGEIDARGTRIRFEVPASELVASGRAQVQLDLGRSLVQNQPERRLLLPHFALRY
jgi:hypothetical protein